MLVDWYCLQVKQTVVTTTARPFAIMTNLHLSVNSAAVIEAGTLSHDPVLLLNVHTP